MTDELDSFLVEAKTINNVLKKNDLYSIDLLQIDTEGFDYSILCNIVFNICMPKVIRYEHLHMSMDQKNYIVNKLALLSYRLIIEDINMITILTIHK